MNRSDGAIEIRRASLADEANILALAPRLIAFGPPPWRDPQGMRATDRKVLAAALRAHAEAATVLVAALDNGAIAGFVHLRPGHDYYTERDLGHIADFVVGEEYEGQGIARRLLAAAEQWALEKGYRWLRLSVFEDNERAVRVYEHMGFRTEILRMVKPLNSDAAQPE